MSRIKKPEKTLQEMVDDVGKSLTRLTNKLERTMARCKELGVTSISGLKALDHLWNVRNLLREIEKFKKFPKLMDKKGGKL